MSNPAPNEIPHLLVHEEADNVGVVVVEGLTAGTDMLCCVTQDNSTFRLIAGSDVPIGHKIALVDLKDGGTAIKYGEDIGKIVADIPKGAHVHTHNCKTKRW
ncbi:MULTISPECIES: UxaA family hydrolase [unclassified Shimia]|uniref:UxaA family hydrolase n=1 Tax=unclassified Shimia TaxID=2630038 RepID=UPI003101E787